MPAQMSNYRSFAARSAHYFSRPHDGIPDGPIDSPAAWRGDALAEGDTWRFPLSSDQIEEFEAAIRAAVATGRPTAELSREDFPLPILGPQIDAWRGELDCGRGFVLITGLPVDRWPDEHPDLFFWCFGCFPSKEVGQSGDLV